MYCDRPVLTKLFFCFVHLTNEINEAFTRFWHALLWPIRELKLPDCSRLTVLRKRKTVCVKLTLIFLYEISLWLCGTFGSD